MPRRSKKFYAIKSHDELMKQRIIYSQIRFLMDITDEEEEEVDDMCSIFRLMLASNRYLNTRFYRKNNEGLQWKCYLYDDIQTTDTEFLVLFRMTRTQFWNICNLIEHDIIFGKKDKAPYKKQRPPECQLLVYLMSCGISGSAGGNKRVAKAFHFGQGTVSDYVFRCTQAFNSLEDKYVFWPNESGRNEIKNRMLAKYGFKNCVGIIDGTLLFLEDKPVENGEDYMTRKGGYAVHCLITCDDNARILNHVCGWCGSAHDNRVWLNSSLYQKREMMFRPQEYLLGDSAFTNCQNMVTTYKRTQGESQLNLEKEFFNRKVATPRIKSEHCIGLLKNRFPVLRGLRHRILGKQSMKQIVNLFSSIAVLHNILVGDADEIPSDWYETTAEDFQLANDHELMQPTEKNEQNDKRRQQIHNYLMVKYGF